VVWGLDETGHFKTDEENRSFLTQKLSKLTALLGGKSGDGSTGSVAQRVLQDLVAVNTALRVEAESANLQDLSNREKGKRLLFLFQRDLLPGVSGKILESKGQRDNIAVQTVSWEAKAAGWAFIGLLNVGMLFYILLFALSQTVHRQGAVAGGGDPVRQLRCGGLHAHLHPLPHHERREQDQEQAYGQHPSV
jgi:hypothetical protein